ncbi:MAG: hypothetical protein AAB074_21285 [Planctomycetota bacterium]
MPEPPDIPREAHDLAMTLRREVRRPQVRREDISGSGGPPRIARPAAYPGGFGPWKPLLGLHPRAQRLDPTTAKLLPVSGSSDAAVQSLRAWWNGLEDPVAGIEAVWGPRTGAGFEGILERSTSSNQMYGPGLEISQKGRQVAVTFAGSKDPYEILLVADELAERLAAALAPRLHEMGPHELSMFVQTWTAREMRGDRLTRRKLLQWTCPPDSAHDAAKGFRHEETAIAVELDRADKAVARVECADRAMAWNCCEHLESHCVGRRLENVVAFSGSWEQFQD